MDMNYLPFSLRPTYPHQNSFYTFKQPRHQIFSFRWPVIKYILKIKTGKAWKNLIKTCKYFFLKYPFYPVKELTYVRGLWDADGERGISVKTFSKIWLFDSFDCCNFNLGSLSMIYKYKLQSLGIYHCDLTWENYQILTSSGSLKDVSFHKSTVKYSDGIYVTVDMLLEKLEQIEKFEICPKPESMMFEQDTAMRMTKILSSFKDLRCFCLKNVDENFHLWSFMDFLMKNEKVLVRIECAENLYYSDAYKRMLETCFGQLLSNPLKKLPLILMPNCDGKNYREYRNLCEN